MMIERFKRILFPIMFTFAYLIFLYFLISFEWEKGLLAISEGAPPMYLGLKVLCEFVSSILIVGVILLITFARKRPLSDIGLTSESPVIVLALFIAYLVLFLLNGNFSARGFYGAFYYLIIVAFTEEFIFRGYLFTAIDNEFGFWIAAIVSGVLFGTAHAFYPAIVDSYSTAKFINQIMNELLGQGILGSAFFAMLYKKSKTLFVPVLIHAIMDYMGVVF